MRRVIFNLLLIHQHFKRRTVQKHDSNPSYIVLRFEFKKLVLMNSSLKPCLRLGLGMASFQIRNQREDRDLGVLHIFL